MATPNVYADQIEWFGRHVRGRDAIVLSVHPHNDRGCAVAAAELAVMAGADRIEGTLFGNGERTGNVDLVTLAMNLFSQGVDPELDLADIRRLVETAEYCNRIPVHERHPYAGELVFTAFSGSHQDAIQKGLAARAMQHDEYWDVPYLPIDPQDVGRRYEEIVRINSQSGKGGVAHVLERDRGVRLPRGLQVEFRSVVQRIADETGEELGPERVWRAFNDEYLAARKPFELVEFRSQSGTLHGDEYELSVTLLQDGCEHVIRGSGTGPIDAFTRALRSALSVDVRVVDYEEHAVGRGADATAACFVEILSAGDTVFGAGLDPNLVTASLEAVLSAVNRADCSRN
jgi:2-isopropylmalate synthase